MTLQEKKKLTAKLGKQKFNTAVKNERKADYWQDWDSFDFKDDNLPLAFIQKVCQTSIRSVEVGVGIGHSGRTCREFDSLTIPTSTLRNKNMKKTITKTRAGKVLTFTKKHSQHKPITAKMVTALFQILDRKVSKNKIAKDLGVVSNGNINSLMFRTVEKLYQEGRITINR